MIPPSPSPLPWPAPPSGLRPLGWAGLLLNTPERYHPHKIAGDARKGMIVLADDERPRLEVSWERLKKSADGDRLVRKRFGAAAGRAEKLPNPAAAPMLLARDAEKQRDRAIAYFPATRRVVEILFLHGTQRENLAMPRQTLAGMVDQPPDRAQRWAFFDVSFAAPAGFLYADARLNLGDMAVTLTRGAREFTAPSVTVRQAYPAKLALARFPLEKWHEDHARSLRHLFADAGAGVLRRGKPSMAAIQTPRGEGFATDAKLRPGLRPFYWRTPRHTRFVTLHDRELDRLHILRATGGAGECGALLDWIARELQWARTG